MVSSIEASVQAGVETALQRSGYGSLEESAEETARRRTSWFGEAGRRRIELQEDMMRRDPVYAEKIARRHAAFPLPWAVASASTPSSVSAAVVPEHCYFDPKPAAAAPTATSTSPVAASVVPTSAARDGNLAACSPTTCSTQCPSRAVTVEVPALAPVVVPASSRITVGVVPERYVLNLESTAVTSTPTSVLGISSAYSSEAHFLMHDAVSSTNSSSVHVSTSTHVPELAAPVVDDVAIATDSTGAAAPTPTICSTGGLNHNRYGDDSVLACLNTCSVPTAITMPQENLPTPPLEPTLALELSLIGSSKCSAVETAVSANSMTSLILDDIQHSSVSSVESDSASLDAQLVVPVKVLSVSSSSTNSVGREDEWRPLPWPSFLCYHGGRPPLLPKNQILCVVGTLHVRDEWPTSVERKPWPPPSNIHGSVPAHQKIKEQNMSPPLPHLASAPVSWDTSTTLSFSYSLLTPSTVLDGTPLTTSADPNDDIPQDEQGVLGTLVTQLTINNSSARTLKPVAAQLHGMYMFRTVPRISWPPMFEEGCTSFAEKMQHLVLLKHKIESGLFLELHSDVMSNSARFWQPPWPWSLFPPDGWQCKLPWTPIQVHSSQKAYLLGALGEFSRLYEICIDLCISMVSMWVVLQALHVGMCLCSVLQEVETFQKHLVFLAELKPWPSWALSVLVVHCHFASVHFQWKLAMQKYTSSSSFLVILNGTTEVQRHYSCTRVLTDVVCRCWISLGGRLVSWKSWFQYRVAGCKPLYGCQNFQWTIAWYLGFLFPRWFRFLMEFSRCQVVTIRGLSFWSYTLPRVDQMMLKGYSTSYAGNSFGVGLLNAIFLQGCLLSCYNGHIIQYGFKLLQWIIAWPVYHAPCQPWFSYCTPGKVVLHNTEPLQGNIQQPEIENFQPLTVKLGYPVTASYLCIAGLFAWTHPLGIFHGRIMLTDYSMVLHIAWDFRGSLFFSNGCGNATDHGRASPSIPWDPGGAVWWRLEGKPPFKEGGMLAPTSTTTMVGPKRQWALLDDGGLGQHQWGTGDIYTRQRATARTRLGTGRLRPPLLLSPVILLPLLLSR